MEKVIKDRLTDLHNLLNKKHTEKEVFKIINMLDRLQEKINIDKLAGDELSK